MRCVPPAVHPKPSNPGLRATVALHVPCVLFPGDGGCWDANDTTYDLPWGPIVLCLHAPDDPCGDNVGRLRTNYRETFDALLPGQTEGLVEHCAPRHPAQVLTRILDSTTTELNALLASLQTQRQLSTTPHPLAVLLLWAFASKVLEDRDAVAPTDPASLRLHDEFCHSAVISNAAPATFPTNPLEGITNVQSAISTLQGDVARRINLLRSPRGDGRAFMVPPTSSSRIRRTSTICLLLLDDIYGHVGHIGQFAMDSPSHHAHRCCSNTWAHGNPMDPDPSTWPRTTGDNGSHVLCPTPCPLVGTAVPFSWSNGGPSLQMKYRYRQYTSMQRNVARQLRDEDGAFLLPAMDGNAARPGCCAEALAPGSLEDACTDPCDDASHRTSCITCHAALHYTCGYPVLRTRVGKTLLPLSEMSPRAKEGWSAQNQALMAVCSRCQIAHEDATGTAFPPRGLLTNTHGSEYCHSLDGRPSPDGSPHPTITIMRVATLNDELTATQAHRILADGEPPTDGKDRPRPDGYDSVLIGSIRREVPSLRQIFQQQHPDGSSTDFPLGSLREAAQRMRDDPETYLRLAALALRNILTIDHERTAARHTLSKLHLGPGPSWLPPANCGNPADVRTASHILSLHGAASLRELTAGPRVSTSSPSPDPTTLSSLPDLPMPWSPPDGVVPQEGVARAPVAPKVNTLRALNLGRPVHVMGSGGEYVLADDGVASSSSTVVDGTSDSPSDGPPAPYTRKSFIKAVLAIPALLILKTDGLFDGTETDNSRAWSDARLDSMAGGKLPPLERTSLHASLRDAVTKLTRAIPSTSAALDCERPLPTPPQPTGGWLLRCLLQHAMRLPLHKPRKRVRKRGPPSTTHTTASTTTLVPAGTDHILATAKAKIDAQYKRS